MPIGVTAVVLTQASPSSTAAPSLLMTTTAGSHHRPAFNTNSKLDRHHKLTEAYDYDMLATQSMAAKYERKHNVHPLPIDDNNLKYPGSTHKEDHPPLGVCPHPLVKL